MNEQNILKHLNRYFATAEYRLNNVFIYDWESDYFCVTTSGYTIEVEVKISRSDFKADAKKAQKHFILKNAAKELCVMPLESWKPQEYSRIAIIEPQAPNKFYYCCPEGLITTDEVPDYAGLLYYRQCPDTENEHIFHSIIQSKPAKFLHKRKPDISKVLLNKYYYMYLHLKQEYKLLMLKCERMQSVYNPDIDLDIKNKNKSEPKYYEQSLFD